MPCLCRRVRHPPRQFGCLCYWVHWKKGKTAEILNLLYRYKKSTKIPCLMVGKGSPTSVGALAASASTSTWSSSRRLLKRARKADWSVRAECRGGGETVTFGQFLEDGKINHLPGSRQFGRVSRGPLQRHSASRHPGCPKTLSCSCEGGSFSTNIETHTCDGVNKVKTT